jgi:hypothetical protein
MSKPQLKAVNMPYKNLTKVAYAKPLKKEAIHTDG